MLHYGDLSCFQNKLFLKSPFSLQTNKVEGNLMQFELPANANYIMTVAIFYSKYSLYYKYVG